MLRKTGLLVACAFLGVTGLHAQPSEVEIAPDADFDHQWTAMEFPVQIGDLKRDRIVAYADNQTNLSANYTGQLGDLFSLYIYRAGVADPSIWFDRAFFALTQNSGYSTTDVAGQRTGMFTPPGGTSESGLLSVIKTGGSYRSTSVAIYASGDWLVKVRYSSKKLDADAMEKSLRGMLAQLPALENISAQPAYLIKSCTTAVKFKKAKRVKMDKDDAMSAALLGALTGLVLDGATEEEESQSATLEKPVTFCREGEATPQHTLYRPDEATDNYTIAFGDAGVSGYAGLDTLANLFSNAESGKAQSKAQYLVSLRDGNKTLNYQPYRSLPKPEQTIKTIFNENAISSSNRPLGDANSKISIGAGT